MKLTENPESAAQQQSESRSLANLEWLVSTPREMGYDLQMDDGTGEVTQDISLTREEYIQLKLHLAKMRGLTIPAKLAGSERLSDEFREFGFYIAEPIWEKVEPKVLEEMGLINA